MRQLAAAALALALAAAATGCGDAVSRSDQVTRACAGAAAGADALHGSGADIVGRVQAAEQLAAGAAHALPAGDAKNPDDPENQAVRALLAQSLRLRLVRSQIERGSAPRVVLQAASRGLTVGDRQTRERLAAVGVHC